MVTVAVVVAIVFVASPSTPIVFIFARKNTVGLKRCEIFDSSYRQEVAPPPRGPCTVPKLNQWCGIRRKKSAYYHHCILTSSSSGTFAVSGVRVASFFFVVLLLVASLPAIVLLRSSSRIAAAPVRRRPVVVVRHFFFRCQRAACLLAGASLCLPLKRFVARKQPLKLLNSRSGRKQGWWHQTQRDLTVEMRMRVRVFGLRGSQKAHEPN